MASGGPGRCGSALAIALRRRASVAPPSSPCCTAAATCLLRGAASGGRGTSCGSAAGPRRLQRGRRSFSDNTLQEVQEGEKPWLALRLEAVPAFPKVPTALPASDLEASIEFSEQSDVVDRALEVAYKKSFRDRWPAIAKRLKAMELEALDAVLILHCMVALDDFDRVLLNKVVDKIEIRYFSMDLALNGEHRVWDVFPEVDNFQSLIHNMPLSHKVKIILRDHTLRTTGEKFAEKPRPEPDGKKMWKTMDPVEMEMWERERFEKGRIKIKRMRDVRAKVTRMQPGNKLRAALATQLLQVLPGAHVQALAEISQVFAFPHTRVLHGDLQNDFREALSRRVSALETHSIIPVTLALASGMRLFDGPQAERAWRRKLLPAVVRIAKAPNADTLLDLQRSFHPRLRGVRHAMGPSKDVAEADEVERLRRRAGRAAQLYVAVLGARQVTVDVALHDGLAGLLESAVEMWRSSDTGGVILEFATLADVLETCASCGMAGGSLPQAMAKLFAEQFGDDIREGSFQLAKYSVADLSTIANAISLLCPDAEDAISLIWIAAAPKIRQAQPHLALMLLNGVVRGGSEELLTSRPVLDVMDELLVQNMDFDTSVLGRLGP